MKTIVLTLIATLALATIASSCGGQGGSSCYQSSSSNCCSNYHNCYSHECCVQKSCCCCSSSSCCNQECKNQTPPPPPPPDSTTQKPTTCTSYPFSSNSSVINNNHNNITIPTNITIQNEIHSETHITIPVNVSVHNSNNILITSSDTDITSGTTCKNDTGKCENNTVYVTVEKPVLVPVPKPFPVPRPIPVPYYIRIPYPIRVPSGCCQMAQPCSPYMYNGCQTSSMQCGSACQSQYMYQPINVCQNGCYRRSTTAMGYGCNWAGCRQGQIDCSQCHPNFYENYDSFSRCSGCFVPSPWYRGEGVLGGGGVYGGGGELGSTWYGGVYAGGSPLFARQSPLTQKKP